MDTLCSVLSVISTGAGYNTNAGANVGIEPISYDGKSKTFVAITVREDQASVVIKNTNRQIFQEVTTYAIEGYIYAAKAGAMRAAFGLRDDITVALMRVNSNTFKNGVGSPFATDFSINGKREVIPAPDDLPLMRVVGRVDITYSQVVTPT
jgi:hypothetical protein